MIDNINRLYIEWLNSQIVKDTSYHDHKETMAWVATALYLPGIIGLGNIIGTTNLICLRVVFTVIIILSCTILLRLFINMQFVQRWNAAERIQIYSEFIVRLLSGKLKLEEDARTMVMVDDVAYPKIIADNINNRLASRCFWNAFLILLSLQWRELDDRWKTELSSYAIVILATIVSIILIWCN